MAGRQKKIAVSYNPEKNRKNIFARDAKQAVPPTRDMFKGNPMNGIFQPQNITKSKRYCHDKLNVSDIPMA